MARTGRSSGRLSWAGGVLLFGLVLFAAVSHVDREAWSHMQSASLWSILGIAASLLVSMLANGLVTRFVVQQFGIHLRLREWTGITFLGSVVNLVTPMKGGAIARAAYLRRFHRLPVAGFLSYQAATAALTVLVNGAIGFLILLSLGVPGGTSGGLVLLTCAMATSLALAGMVWSPRVEPRGPLSTRVSVVLDGWRAIHQDRLLVARLLLLTTIAALAHVGAFVLAFRSAGWQGNVLVPGVSAALSKIGGLAGLTPGGLGVYEAFGVLGATLVEGQFGAAALALLLVRVVSVVVALVSSAVVVFTHPPDR